MQKNSIGKKTTNKEHNLFDTNLVIIFYTFTESKPRSSRIRKSFFLTLKNEMPMPIYTISDGFSRNKTKIREYFFIRDKS